MAWPYANIMSNHSQDHPVNSNQIKKNTPCWVLLTTGALSMVWSGNDKRCKTLGNWLIFVSEAITGGVFVQSYTWRNPVAFIFFRVQT